VSKVRSAYLQYHETGTTRAFTKDGDVSTALPSPGKEETLEGTYGTEKSITPKVPANKKSDEEKNKLGELRWTSNDLKRPKRNKEKSEGPAYS